MAFLILALLSFSAMGVLHKLGDRLHAHPVLVATLCMGVAGLLNGAKTALVPGSGLQSVPSIVPLMALPFGAAAGLALWLFQKALPHGRIATGWLIVNLSSAVPTLFSVIVYGDPLGAWGAAGLALLLTCLACLWGERRAAEAPLADSSPVSPWLTLMTATFVLNGASPVGLKILAKRALPEEAIGPYLTFWYLGGLACLLPVVLTRRVRPQPADWLVGAGLGVCSLTGQTCLAAALKAGVSGAVAYPVALSGGLVLVVLAGVAIFRERVGRLGAIGIVLGLAAMALLSMP
jgi:drug/metabolite transporter (DMT)-like permease